MGMGIKMESSNSPFDIGSNARLFNERPDMIADAIRSILRRHIEILNSIFFDDSTNDETKAVIDSFCSESPREHSPRC